MKSVLIGVGVIAGIVVLSYGAFSLMVNAIPIGQPVAVAKVDETYNDPSNLSPREPALPKGVHQIAFQSNCIVCHSARLAMTQPSFNKAKWTEVVHKMVVTYGAKIVPAEEGQVVEYLMDVKGVK